MPSEEAFYKSQIQAQKEKITSPAPKQEKFTDEQNLAITDTKALIDRAGLEIFKAGGNEQKITNILNELEKNYITLRKQYKIWGDNLIITEKIRDVYRSKKTEIEELGRKGQSVGPIDRARITAFEDLSRREFPIDVKIKQ